MEIISRQLKPADMMNEYFALLLNDHSDIKKWYKLNALNFNRLRTVKPQDVESVTITYTTEYHDEVRKTIDIQLKRSHIKVLDTMVEDYIIDLINEEFEKYAHPLIIIDNPSEQMNGKIVKSEIEMLKDAYKRMI